MAANEPASPTNNHLFAFQVQVDLSSQLFAVSLNLEGDFLLNKVNAAPV
jgi:hypothetical protein